MSRESDNQRILPQLTHPDKSTFKSLTDYPRSYLPIAPGFFCRADYRILEKTRAVELKRIKGRMVVTSVYRMVDFPRTPVRTPPSPETLYRFIEDRRA